MKYIYIFYLLIIIIILHRQLPRHIELTVHRVAFKNAPSLSNSRSYTVCAPLCTQDCHRF